MSARRDGRPAGASSSGRRSPSSWRSSAGPPRGPPSSATGKGSSRSPTSSRTSRSSALVGFLATRAGRVAEGGAPRRTLATVAVGALLWGVSDEWHQSFTPGRDSEAADVAADVAGTLLGVAAFELLARASARGGSRPA